jgi:uncharacterized protein
MTILVPSQEDFAKVGGSAFDIDASGHLVSLGSCGCGGPNGCGGCGKQIVISPTGEIGICHEGLGERRTFIGSLNEDFDFQTNPHVQKWAYRSPATMPECVDCPALGMCGGGCPYGAMLRYGSIHDIDKRFCVHSKDTLEWLVWDLYDKVMTRVGAS